MERVVAEYAGHEFRRCPFTYVDARGEELVLDARRPPAPDERLRLTAKRLEAVTYVRTFVVRFEERPE